MAATAIPMAILSQRLVTAEGSIALLTVEGRGMHRRVLQVLLQRLIAAESSITLLTVEYAASQFEK